MYVNPRNIEIGAKAEFFERASVDYPKLVRKHSARTVLEMHTPGLGGLWGVVVIRNSVFDAALVIDDPEQGKAQLDEIASGDTRERFYFLCKEWWLGSIDDLVGAKLYAVNPAFCR